MNWIGQLISLSAIVSLVLFIMATRLSYRIEARSDELRNTSGLPRNAMLFHTVTNRGVARDPQTQGLRRQMNLMLLAAVAILLGMGLTASLALG
jgi:hypothetical protein